MQNVNKRLYILILLISFMNISNGNSPSGCSIWIRGSGNGLGCSNGVAVSILASVDPFGIDVDFFFQRVDYCRVFHSADATLYTAEFYVTLDYAVHGLFVAAEWTVKDFLELGRLLFWGWLCCTFTFAHFSFWEGRGGFWWMRDGGGEGRAEGFVFVPILFWWVKRKSKEFIVYF